MAVQPAPHRFSVEDYYRLSEIGVLPPDVRTELLEGEILEMTTIGSRHAESVDRFNMAFVRRLGHEVIVRVQNPVRLDDFSEPQPDISVLRARPGGYGAAHPLPPDILLLVEVADTTLRFDRLRKMPAYARAGIAEFWLVDLEVGVVERYRSPSGESYETVDLLAADQEVAPGFAPHERFRVGSFIP